MRFRCLLSKKSFLDRTGVGEASAFVGRCSGRAVDSVFHRTELDLVTTTALGHFQLSIIPVQGAAGKVLFVHAATNLGERHVEDGKLTRSQFRLSAIGHLLDDTDYLKGVSTSKDIAVGYLYRVERVIPVEDIGCPTGIIDRESCAINLH